MAYNSQFYLQDENWNNEVNPPPVWMDDEGNSRAHIIPIALWILGISWFSVTIKFFCLRLAGAM